jgi:hypothetical protein
MDIQRGIPVPVAKHSKYNFDDWEVGDSILLDTLEAADSAQTSAKAWADRRGNGAQFTRRKVEDGIRLWRIA